MAFADRRESNRSAKADQSFRWSLVVSSFSRSTQNANANSKQNKVKTSLCTDAYSFYFSHEPGVDL